MTLVIVLFLLLGLWETEALSVEGKVGKEVTIKCSHSNAGSNVKYFCKDPCKNEDILVTSKETNEDDSNGKYSIKDEGNTFTVTISDLTEDDSGAYWCGIERFGVDTYNKVVLTVKKEAINNRRSTFQRSNLDEASLTNSSSPDKLVYIGAGLGVVVLALAVVLLVFFRNRKRDISANGKHLDTVYATPSIEKQDALHETTSYSAKEDQETDGSIVSSPSNQHHDANADHTDNIYSNITVSSEPEIQPDGLFYSTVSFNEHADFSTVLPRTATVTYSSLKHTSTDESTVYDNV
ncbi:CMRF35-like molecule 1 [Acanthochromis polyacanthus]|uniref:CMRF35-like molecule 1 n=1 Tax=Acanthochromis polyacanthus TaxID=80966 RepID=UPI000B8F2504|nr:CMRF35-like molecule 1 [Acanthochromis polyacanthus]